MRGLTLSGTAAAHRHGTAIHDLEGRLWSLDLERLVQAHTADAVLDVLGEYYELAFLPAAVVVGVALAIADRALYLELRTAMMASLALAAVVFAVYPTAPPRLVPQLGMVDVVGMRGHDAGSAHGIRFNPYAAMPSMHVGWTLLVAVALVRALRRHRFGWLLWLHPVLMTWAVIATGNHYLLDVVVGVGVAAAGWAVMRRLTARETEQGLWRVAGARQA